MQQNLKITLFAGAADKSLLIEAILMSHEIELLVLPDSKKYEASVAAMKLKAEQSKIPFVICKTSELENLFASRAVELLLSSGYPFKIPEPVFSKAQFAFNFHPTLLPKYRGRYLHPILINNDKETGVTCHILDANYDTGPIVKQYKYPVLSFDTIKSLNRKNIQAEVTLAMQVLDDVQKNQVSFMEQDEEQASSFFEQRTPEDSRLDASKSLQDLFYEIRAYDPDLYPAFFEVDGQKVFVKIYRKNRSEKEQDMV